MKSSSLISRPQWKPYQEVPFHLPTKAAIWAAVLPTELTASVSAPASNIIQVISLFPKYGKRTLFRLRASTRSSAKVYLAGIFPFTRLFQELTALRKTVVYTFLTRYCSVVGNCFDTKKQIYSTITWMFTEKEASLHSKDLLWSKNAENCTHA